ncbi:MAG TPA: hypothetical protein DCZ43_01460, partial [candidate division Zixibacteria bacterium]|nr:hypothetical protein [candidate division Zixibacteria bacterium]
MSGRQNGNDTSFTFSTGIDSVKVVSPAQIQIDSTYAMSRNAPFVNTSQPCSLKVLMENMGDERANSFYMHLSSTGGSDFPDSIFVPFLDGHHNLAVIFPITASSVPNPNEIFASSISGGTGSMSGNPALINPPVDNNSLLITETPAELWLSQINIIAPPGALDSTISIDQVVTLSVTVINLGQAAISGPRNLTFYPGDISWGVDSLQRDYMLGLPTIWQVTAPSIAIDSAGLSIGITGSPIDENDGST